jgi:hypothetical protein
VNAWDAAAAAVGETAAASTSPPIGATVMLPVLRAAFKDVLLVDATFRRQRLAGHDGPIIQVGAPDFHPDSAERGFYRRFRQAGGHLPLFWFDDAHNGRRLVEHDGSGHAECESTLRILEVLRRYRQRRFSVRRGRIGGSRAGTSSPSRSRAVDPSLLRAPSWLPDERTGAPSGRHTGGHAPGNARKFGAALGQQLLSRGIAPELLYYGMEGLTARQEAAMSAFWSRFHFVKSTPLPPPSLGSCWGVDDWCPDQLCERIRSLHARNRYAAVLVNYVWMSRVLVDLAGVLRIIDTRDLFGDRHLVCRAVGLEPRWFFTSAAEEVRGSNGRTAASRGANAGAGPGPFPGTPCRRWGTTPARA